MIGFTGGVTYGMTEWKRTLEKAITQEKKQGKFPKLFQEKFVVCRKTVSLREAIVYALGELPLQKEATELLSCYFAELGKSTKKTRKLLNFIKNPYIKFNMPDFCVKCRTISQMSVSER